MAKLFNENGSINKTELNRFTNDLDEIQRLREEKINRNEIRVKEIDNELDELNEQLYLIQDELDSFTYIPGSISENTLILMDNVIRNKIQELEEEREELTDKYNI